jgi:hypothetical protein
MILTKSEYLQAISFGITPLLTLLVINLLGKFKAFQPNDLQSQSIDPISEDEYRKVSQYYALIIFVSMIVAGFLLFLGFVFVARLYFSSFVQTEIIRMPEITYGVPSIFIGIVISYLPGDYFLRKYLKEKYQSYIKAGELKYRIDGKKFLKYVANFITLLAIFSFVYLLRCTSFLQDNVISINRFGTFTTKLYKLGDVIKVVHSHHLLAPNGNTVHRSNYDIFFLDNFKWNIDDEGDGPEFVQVISKKSGQPISEED